MFLGTLQKKGKKNMSGEKIDGSNFKTLKDGWGIQPMGPSPKGGDMHETFQVNKDGDISGGHTTVRIPGGKSVSIPWTSSK